MSAFQSPTPARIAKGKLAWLLHDDCEWNSLALDLPGQSFCAGETIEVKSGTLKNYYMLSGFRQWDSSLAYPGHIALVRVMKSMTHIEDDINSVDLEKHRSKVIYQQHSDILVPERELVATDVYTVVTDRQLLKGKKILCLETLRMIDILGKPATGPGTSIASSRSPRSHSLTFLSGGSWMPRQPGMPTRSSTAYLP